jgi:hypothetical protein
LARHRGLSRRGLCDARLAQVVAFLGGRFQ